MSKIDLGYPSPLKLRGCWLPNHRVHLCSGASLAWRRQTTAMTLGISKITCLALARFSMQLIGHVFYFNENAFFVYLPCANKDAL